MAKLNVVIPAVEVTVDGTVYRKVDRKAQVGDIVKALRDHTDVSVGSFYAVTYRDGQPTFYDDAEDGRASLLRERPRSFEVYAPITEGPAAPKQSDTITFEGATYRKVDREARVGDALRFTDEDREDILTERTLYTVVRLDSCDDAQVLDDDGDEFDTCGEVFEVYERVAEEYREVKRHAKVGERIRITKKLPIESRYENGAEATVKRARADGVFAEFNGSGCGVSHSEYVVLEPVTQAEAQPGPERLTVGDYAKVIDNNTTHNYVVGSFIKIVTDDKSFAPYKGEKADGSIGNWLALRDVEPATEREFLAQRRPNVGEYVRVTDGVGGYSKVGDIAKIAEDDGTSVPFKLETLDGKYAGWNDEKGVVRATDEEIAAAKDAADPRSKFAAGDKVRLLSGGGSYPLNGFNNGEMYEVRAPKYDTHHTGPVIQIVRGRSDNGYATADQLEKVSAEELKWAAIGRKVNEYKVGDIVKFNGGHGVHGLRGHEGITTEVSEISSGRLSIRLKRPEFVEYRGYDTWTQGSNLTLITPVEQRFDREKEAA